MLTIFSQTTFCVCVWGGLSISLCIGVNMCVCVCVVCLILNELYTNKLVKQYLL